MSNIKVYTSYDYRNNCYRYTNFEIVNELPEINDTMVCNSAQTETIIDIEKMTVEGNQPTGKCYEYDYYTIKTEMIEKWWDDEPAEISYNEYFYAVEKPCYEPVYVIRCRETGDEITYFTTLKDAEKCLEHYAYCDMLDSLADGECKKDTEPFKEFYEIVPAYIDDTNNYIYD